MKRKPTHGGARKNAGAPTTTGMTNVPPVHFRVSQEQHDELVAEGRKAKLSANAVAKKRTFP